MNVVANPALPGGPAVQSATPTVGAPLPAGPVIALPVAPAQPAPAPAQAQPAPAQQAPAQPAAAPASGAEQKPAEKPPFPPPAPVPTQEVPGTTIRYDFNNGARAVLPQAEHPWKVRLTDLDTGNILFETTFAQGTINSSKRYYIRFKLEIFQQDKEILSHEYSAKDREILIQFPVGTLGDTMGWFPYAVKFQKQHGCKLTCAMGEKLIPLFKPVYPNITFVTHEDVKAEKYYATYSIGLFFDDKDFIFQPCDFRFVGLHRTAGYILGVDPTEEPPKLALLDDSRPIKEPYVVIATQSTTQSKYWNNPEGWRAIIKMLKDAGYRVICIDQKATPRHRPGVEPHSQRRRGRDRRSHPAGARALAEALRVLHRPVERPSAGSPGRRAADRDDRGLHPSVERVRDALSRDQLSHLQQLLERSAPSLRPQGLPVVPAPQGHAAPVRMHAADHRRSRQAGDQAHPRLRSPRAHHAAEGKREGQGEGLTQHQHRHFP